MLIVILASYLLSITFNSHWFNPLRPFSVILLWEPLPDEEAVPMKDRWFRKIYSFSKVSETLLLGWISGREAEYMETLKMSQVADVCTNILRKFLADPYVPKPKSCIL